MLMVMDKSIMRVRLFSIIEEQLRLSMNCYVVVVFFCCCSAVIVVLCMKRSHGAKTRLR